MIGRSFAASLLLGAALLFGAAAPARGGSNACAGGGSPRPDEGGIGGTGARLPGPGEDEGGVGGTGVSEDGGIGGTGISADTGIIGTITGFASICVGEVEIHYGPDSVVEVDGAAASAADLAVGQVVEVVASGTGSELSAHHISVRHVVAGPVTRSDPERNQLEVIGQTVQLSAATLAAEADAAEPAVAADYPPGTPVRVSGLRRGDGRIVASLVAREQRDVARLAGPVARIEPGLLAIGATRVALASHAPAPSVGEEVRITGRWDGEQLVAAALESIPATPFRARVDRLEIEGYASALAAGRLKVGPFLVELAATIASESPPAGARVRVQGVVRDRRVIVDRIGVLPEPPALPEVRGAPRLPKGAPGGARTGEEGAAGGGKPEQFIPRGPRNALSPADSGRGGLERPQRPARPERAPGAPLPERPLRVDLPAPPERPPRPERPPLLERPPRLERPVLPRP